MPSQKAIPIFSRRAAIAIEKTTKNVLHADTAAWLAHVCNGRKNKIDHVSSYACMIRRSIAKALASEGRGRPRRAYVEAARACRAPPPPPRLYEAIFMGIIVGGHM